MFNEQKTNSVLFIFKLSIPFENKNMSRILKISTTEVSLNYIWSIRVSQVLKITASVGHSKQERSHHSHWERCSSENIIHDHHPSNALPPRKRKQRGPDEHQHVSKHYSSLSTGKNRKHQINSWKEIHRQLQHAQSLIKNVCENSQASLENCQCPISSQSQWALCCKARSGPAVAWPGLCSPAGTPAASRDTCNH